MAKIHINCEDAIQACERSIEAQKVSCATTYNDLCSEKPLEDRGDITDFVLEDERKYHNLKMKHNLLNENTDILSKIEALMHGAAYLKHKDRRLILDTQSEEFGLISNFLPTE